MKHTEAVLRGLCELAESHAQLTDGQLLARFAADRDERAFAALIHRHGGLVYAVCRNVLRHEQEAEDAFQGTFLVLVRLAGTIREEKALASWLYRVAYRVATRARRAAARRRRHEEQTAKPPGEEHATDLGWRELQAMLDEELNRLPEKYRSPFVLCCLTGLSKSEAAAQLGWKEGTVSSRLAQARELLRARLARRGVSLSAILSGLAVAQGASAAVPVALQTATLKSALAFAAGEPVGASAPAAFAHAVLRTMAPGRLKLAVVALALAGLVTGAAVALNQPEPEVPPPPPEVVAAPPPPVVDPQPALPVRAVAELPGTRMTVGGTVTGPDGKAVPGARVAVIAGRLGEVGERRTGRLATSLLGEGQADEQGRFRLVVPQTDAGSYRLNAVAFAPGCAVSDFPADPPAYSFKEHTLPVRLAPGFTARARLTDDTNRPVKGAKVHVLGLKRDAGPDGILVFYEDPPVPLPGWPVPEPTDDDGVFSVPNVGPGTTVYCQVRDERFAAGWFTFTAGKGERAEPIPVSLPAPRVLEGTVTAEDTGKPLAGVSVVAETSYASMPAGYAEGRTDAEGRYRIRPCAGESPRLFVYPAPDQPYLSIHREVKWPAGARSVTNNVVLPRGVLVRGKVREAGTGKPIPDAGIRYEIPSRNNPQWAALRKRPDVQWDAALARTDAEGAFSIAVPPGPGTLLVKAAEPDFLHVETSTGKLIGAKAGGTPYFADALLPMTLRADGGEQTPAIELRRGVTLRGRVVGADGAPVPSAMLLCTSFAPAGWDYKGRALPVRHGRFELPGCEPGAKVTVYVFDTAKNEGATAELTANPDSEPEVKLAPCSTAKVKVVDKAGKPVAARITTFVQLRAGDDSNTSLARGTTAELLAWTVVSFGRGYAPHETAAGVYTVPYLIPNAPYLFRVAPQAGSGVSFGPPQRVTFTAAATGPRELTVTFEAQPRPPR